jgi:hypothetical protein
VGGKTIRKQNSTTMKIEFHSRSSKHGRARGSERNEMRLIYEGQSRKDSMRQNFLCFNITLFPPNTTTTTTHHPPFTLLAYIYFYWKVLSGQCEGKEGNFFLLTLNVVLRWFSGWVRLDTGCGVWGLKLKTLKRLLNSYWHSMVPISEMLDGRGFTEGGWWLERVIFMDWNDCFMGLRVFWVWGWYWNGFGDDYWMIWVRIVVLVDKIVVMALFELDVMENEWTNLGQCLKFKNQPEPSHTKPQKLSKWKPPKILSQKNLHQIHPQSLSSRAAIKSRNCLHLSKSLLPLHKSLQRKATEKNSSRDICNNHFRNFALSGTSSLIAAPERWDEKIPLAIFQDTCFKFLRRSLFHAREMWGKEN